MTRPDKAWENVPPRGRLLRPTEVVQRTGLSKSQVYAMIAAGDFPPFLKISARASGLPESWLNAFVEGRAFELSDDLPCAGVVEGGL